MNEAGGALEHTGLHAIHEELGAKMVPFAGFSMPVQYRSITAEHRAVRERVGIFDVSHMGEVEFVGPAAADALQALTVNDVAVLEIDHAQYSAMVNADGGLIDDLLVYRVADERYLAVVNAANIARDRAHMRAHLPADGVEMTDRSEATSLVAVQGPKVVATIAPLADVRVAEIPYYTKRDGTVAGVRTMISRTGYTGEDGFELYFDRRHSESVWKAIMEAGAAHGIEPCGLAARDTLRLEMRYALYGNDMDETTNPYEAGLGWIVKLDAGPFHGREALVEIKARGPGRRLVGFRLHERGIPRAGYPVTVEGEEVSVVQSGAMSPSLGYGIGTCYLPRGSAAAGTGIGIVVRGRVLTAEVVQAPFYTAGSLAQ